MFLLKDARAGLHTDRFPLVLVDHIFCVDRQLLVRVQRDQDVRRVRLSI